ncbi:unnamed protein product [Euphydryas editha]|uniref:Uncharacterized protein n=1 Tax=Euphydryas editha TaxID=104508 RepID=A0AAU9TFQ3_EUPED|nr:unnamed protein product [Euphydryas editha]
MKALRVLYEAWVKSHLEYNSFIQLQTKLNIKMVELIQNKFIWFLYFKLYGVYPGYPLLYPTLFLLGMVGYSKMKTGREICFAKYIFKVLRGKIDNPYILRELKLRAPNNAIERRRRPRLLALPCTRTNLLRNVTLMRALRAVNAVADQIDLFSCTLNEFTKIVSTNASYDPDWV